MVVESIEHREVARRARREVERDGDIQLAAGSGKSVIMSLSHKVIMSLRRFNHLIIALLVLVIRFLGDMMT